MVADKSQKISESVENYLESILFFEEEGQKCIHISSIAKRLKVSQPSVVEMLRKLEKRKFVVYKTREGVELTPKGRKNARRIIRNHRLVELLMSKTLKIVIDEDEVCGIEHHMDKDFANALCTLLGHPQRCPHGKPIPRGQCCMQ